MYVYCWRQSCHIAQQPRQVLVSLVLGLQVCAMTLSKRYNDVLKINLKKKRK